MRAADRDQSAYSTAKPWVLAEGRRAAGALQEVCSTAMDMLPAFTYYLIRFCQSGARGSEAAWTAPLKCTGSRHAVAARSSLNTKHLMTRIDPKQITLTGRANRGKPPACCARRTAAPRQQACARAAAQPAAQAGEPFMLKVGSMTSPRSTCGSRTIVNAEQVDGADKLLEAHARRRPARHAAGLRRDQIGLRPGQLKGRLTIVVANLAPRKMKFGLSEGMVLAASGDGGVLYLAPDGGAQPGMKVK